MKRNRTCGLFIVPLFIVACSGSTQLQHEDGSADVRPVDSDAVDVSDFDALWSGSGRAYAIATDAPAQDILRADAAAVADSSAPKDAGTDTTLAPRVVVFPHPTGIAKCQDYTIKVAGKEVFCYQDYRFDKSGIKNAFLMPVSSQGFAIFDFEGTVEVQLKLAPGVIKNAADLRIAPKALDINPTVQGNKVSFTLQRPVDVTIDPQGDGTRVLHLFTNTPEVNPPKGSGPNLRYFGPGVHDIDEQIVLASGQTLYLAGGAVLRPLISTIKPGSTPKTHYTGITYDRCMEAIVAKGADDVVVRGRGVISGERALPARKRFPLFFSTNGKRLSMEGVVFTRSSSWTVHLYNCTDCTIDRLRVLGYFTNSDAIVMKSCKSSVVRNSFVHVADDGLGIKTSKVLPSDGVTFENSQTWVDAGTPMGLTHEIHQEARNTTFRNITVLRYTQATNAVEEIPYRASILVKPAYGGKVSNLLFENITIEDHSTTRPLIMVHNGKYTIPGQTYGTNTPHAEIYGMRFRNIKATTSQGSHGGVWLYDDQGGLFSNISFEGVTIDGTTLGQGSSMLTLHGNPGVSFSP